MPAVGGLAVGLAGGIGVRGDFITVVVAVSAALTVGACRDLNTIGISLGQYIDITMSFASLTVVSVSRGIIMVIVSIIVRITAVSSSVVSMAAARRHLRCPTGVVEASAHREVGDVRCGGRRKPAPKSPQHVPLRHGGRCAATLLAELSGEPRSVGSASAAPHHSTGPVEAVSVVRLSRQIAATRLAAQGSQGHIIVREKTARPAPPSPLGYFEDIVPVGVRNLVPRLLPVVISSRAVSFRKLPYHPGGTDGDVNDVIEEAMSITTLTGSSVVEGGLNTGKVFSLRVSCRIAQPPTHVVMLVIFSLFSAPVGLRFSHLDLPVDLRHGGPRAHP